MATLQAIGIVTEFKDGESKKGNYWQSFRLENDAVFVYPLSCFYMGDVRLTEGDKVFVIGSLLLNEHNGKSYQKLDVKEIGIILQQAERTLSDVVKKPFDQKPLKMQPLAETLPFADDEIPF